MQVAQFAVSQFALALAALAAIWLVMRRQVGGGSCWVLLPLDLAPIVLGWLLLLGITARPVMSAVFIVAAGAGLALTDAVKRATLLEPVMFADRAELLEVVRHPSLYLPFAGPLRVIGGAVAAAALVAALFWLEPPAAHPSPLLPAVLIAAALFLPGWRPLLRPIAACYRRLGASSDPVADMQRFGLLGGMIVEATLAREERARRRAAIPPFAHSPQPGGPLVVVQIESFFDARRLGPAMPRDLLPGFERLSGGAVQTGQLSVPCWGANTVRTEFMALTGIGAEALGLDRFNPYERFAQVRLRSLAWQMKQAGYRTIFLHPFDKRFYARHRVLPQLGFDEFRGMEAFASAPAAGHYVSDEAVAEAAVRIVREEGPRVFVFAVTMGNHGPWQKSSDDSILPEIAASDALPERLALRRFLAGLQASDRMLPILMNGLPSGSVLTVFGDHQPSLPEAFRAMGFTDQRTDYAVWKAGDGVGPKHDIAVEDLACLLLQQFSPLSSWGENADVDGSVEGRESAATAIAQRLV